MLRVSVALASNFSSILSLAGLDFSKPITFGLDKGQTAADIFGLYGTIDAAATDATNATLVGVFSGSTPQPLNKDFAKTASGWPYLLVQRTGGSTAGTFYATGDAATNPAVATTAAPAGVLYSAVLTLTTFGAIGVRIGADAASLVGDVFDVFVTEDSTVTSSAGCQYAGRICGGGGNGAEPNSLVVTGFPYAIVQRVSGSTAGNIIAAGVGAVSVGAGAWVQGGNAFGAPGVLGTTDAQSMSVIAGGGTFLTDAGTAGGAGTYGRATTTATTNVVSGTGGTNVGANATDHATVVGSVTGASLTTVRGGTNGVAVTATGAGPVAITGGTGASVWDIGAAGSLGLGSNATDHSTSIGSTAGASPIVMQAGTSGILASTGGPIRTVGSRVETPPAAIADGTGSLGTAATTVDVASVLEVNQTTPVVLYANMRLIQVPTNAALHGRRVTIVNVGTAAFIVGDATQKQGINLIPGTTPGGAASANKGQSCTFIFNGTAWVPDDTGPGVPVIAAGLADGSASIPRAGRYTIYRIATWTQNGTLTASLTGAMIGDYIDIIRDDGSAANTLTVNNAAAAALVVAPASKKATIRIAYLGTGDWQLAGGGAF